MHIAPRSIVKIGFLISLVVLVGVLMVRGEIGSTFANHSGEGGLQLTIDSYSVYNDQFQPNLSWELKDLVPGVDKFFNFDDIKPGDTGFNNISIHVAQNPAYVCLDFSNLVDEENGVNEPESLVDDEDGGELSTAIEFFAWRDDGDNVFEVGERTLFGDTPESAVVVLNDTTYPLADATTDEVFEEDETYYVGIEWCAGTLSVDLDTAEISCDGETMGNEYQTDSFTVDVSLRAVEASSFTDYTCKDPGLELFLEKKFSGPSLGFVPEQFSFLVEGGEISEVVPHGGSIDLPIGIFTLTELVPEGFDVPDWRIQWSGDTCTGENVPGSVGVIEIENTDLRKITSYCRIDNQFRPERGNNGHGNDTDGNDDSNPGSSNDPDDDTDEDGLPPGQQAAGGPPGQQTQQWNTVESNRERTIRTEITHRAKKILSRFNRDNRS